MSSSPPLPSQETLSTLMDRCLVLATEAAQAGEVPIGALVWRDGEILAEARNEIEKRADPTAHAEVLAIQRACTKIGNWRLENAILLVTLEPCTMCTGAIFQSRIPTVVFGGRDPRAGAIGSLYDLSTIHKLRVIQGVRDIESLSLLRDFFDKIRKSESLKT